MRLTRESSMLLFYYIFICICWVIIYLLGIRGTNTNYYYQFAFGLIPLFGGISGMMKAKHWGFLRSKLGSAVFFISAGLTAWGIGQMFWSLYYNILLGVETPYPSLSDFGYISAVPLWAVGMYYLSHVTGARFSINKFKGKIVLFIIPLILISFSYYLLVIVARNGSISDLDGSNIKVFLDFAYPIGDALILTLAGLTYFLSYDYLGGKYKRPILFLLAGFLVMYIVDFSFSYVTTSETYYNGHWVDLLFPTALTLMALAVNDLDIKN